MKKLLYSFLLLTSVLRADIFDSLGFGKLDNTFNVVIGTDKTRQDLGHLKTQLDLLQKEERTSHEELHLQSEKYKNQITTLETTRTQDGQYKNKLVLSLKSVLQALSTIKSLRKEWIATLKQHIALLEDYVKDPDFFGIAVETKTLYTVEDVQALGDHIAAQEERVEVQQGYKKETSLDLENTQKKLAAAEKTYKDKLKEQSEFGRGLQAGERYVRVKSELLDAEVVLAGYERDALSLRIKEKEAKLALLNDTIFIEERKLEVLKKKSDFIVRISLRVDVEDVRQAEEKFKKEKQRYLTITDRYLQSIEKATGQQEKIKRELTFLEKTYDEPGKDIQNLSEWVSTVQSVEGYLILGEMGFKNDELLLVDREIELLQAQSEYEKLKFKAEELTTDMVLSWHKIKHQRFKTSDELFAEVKKYQDLAAELLRERSMSDDKRNAATNRLNLENRALSNLKGHKDAVRVKMKGFITHDENKYLRMIEYFDKSHALISQQIEITGSLIETYSKLLVSINSSLKHIDAMIFELQRVSLWHRSRGAISQEGFKNILPDIRIFFSDLETLTMHSLNSFSDSQQWLIGLFEYPLTL